MGKGLVGIIGDGSAAELHAMADRISYRGPARIWSPAPGIHFGELSGAPHFEDEADPVLALDSSGWLYESASQEQLGSRERMKQERKQLLAQLERRGPEALADVSGLFALAYWNEANRTVTLACDRQGYKGLYFIPLNGRLAFASDFKALLALDDCPAQINREVLQTYLRSRSFSSRHTLLAAAQTVGRAMTVTVGMDRRYRRQPYWEPARQTSGPRRFNEAAREFRSILEHVLRRQLAGYRQVGLSLSGGLDSASILALLKQVRSDIKVTTYTIGHGQDDRDIIRARAAAERFHTTHREYFYDLRCLPQDLERLVWMTEDLTGREEALLQQSVIARAAAHDRVLLAGHGADAALAGMPRHRVLWLQDRAPWPLKRGVHEFFAYTQTRTEPRSWLGQRLVALKFGSSRPEMPPVVGASGEPAAQPMSFGQYRRVMVNSLEGLRYHEPLETSADVTLVAPFLDPAVMQFALDCPSRFLIGWKSQKRVLRAALRDVAPAQISGLPKTIQRLKHNSAFADLLDSLARRLNVFAALADRGVVDRNYLSRAKSAAGNGIPSSDRLHVLWTLICTELWMRQFVDARGAPVTGSLDLESSSRVA